MHRIDTGVSHTTHVEGPNTASDAVQVLVVAQTRAHAFETARRWT